MEQDLTLGQQDTPEHKPTIELVFYPKNAHGVIIGPPKTVEGDGFKVWRGWMNGNGPGAKFKKSKEKGATVTRDSLPRGKEADKLAKEAALYAELQQESRQ